MTKENKITMYVTICKMSPGCDFFIFIYIKMLINVYTVYINVVSVNISVV